jgi:hypothetical protein
VPEAVTDDRITDWLAALGISHGGRLVMTWTRTSWEPPDGADAKDLAIPGDRAALAQPDPNQRLVSLEFPLDTDGGLDLDADDDGLPLAWEMKYNLDPESNDADGDPDADGLSNADEFQLGTDPTRADTDSDGIPDPWEVARGLLPTAGDGDLDVDRDRFSNLKEYIAGTDPHDRDDYHRMTGTAHGPGGAQVTVYWLSRTGRHYRVLGSPDLDQWDLLHESSGDDSEQSYTDESTVPTVRLFRVDVELE